MADTDWTPEAYAEATRHLDTSPLRARFIAALKSSGPPLASPPMTAPPSAARPRVLDVGPGSGRDARAFRDLGFGVVGIDPSSEMAQIAAAFAGIEVTVQRAQDLDVRTAYEGVWACASLLHVPLAELPDTFNRLAWALVPGGVLYASFKWAGGARSGRVDYEDRTDRTDRAEHENPMAVERTQDGRHFTDLTPEGLRQILRQRPEPAPALEEVDLWKTLDVRPDQARAGAAWLNVLVRRGA
jgi:SAM-dependent methyltransferase